MMKNKSEAIRLLCDGQEAFPEILSCIRNAKRSIEINMFIWRNDEIGKTIARELLAAADRGVSVEITKDRYGIVCEYCEEDQTSFFYPRPTLNEMLSIRTLEFLYNADLFGKEQYDQIEPLAVQMKEHPKIRIFCEEVRKDHSKHYIFDDEILIFGGINIEDKENGKDRRNRFYRDYMVKLSGKAYVDAFRQKKAGNGTSEMYAVNVKQPLRVFELKERYLELIQSAEKTMTIVMPYFSNMEPFQQEIKNALQRGVAVRILIPKKSNFNDDGNKRAMTCFWRYAQTEKKDLSIYLSPDLTHAKLMISESWISVGSCNITGNAFQELDEANLFWPNDDSPFAYAARESAEKLIRGAEPVTEEAQLHYSRIRAAMEHLVM